MTLKGKKKLSPAWQKARQDANKEAILQIEHIFKQIFKSLQRKSSTVHFTRFPQFRCEYSAMHL